MSEPLPHNSPGSPILSFQKAGSGPVIVLLHGFPDDNGLWREVIPALAERYTVLCPDLPGAGSSELPAGTNLTVEAMADALAALLQKEAPAPALLAGHSMGGYVSLSFAERWPQSLAGLALVHTTAAPDTPEKTAQRKKAIALIQKGGKEAFMKEAVPAMFSSSTREQNPGLVQTQITRGLRLADENAVQFYEAIMARPDRQAVLDAAKFPVHWILGGDDSVIQVKDVVEQTHRSERSGVSILQDCGHLSMLEKPASMAEHLLRFADYCFSA